MDDLTVCIAEKNNVVDELNKRVAERDRLYDQVEAWKYAFTVLADFTRAELPDDHGGSSDLCTCDQQPGWPHDGECGAFLTSGRDEA